MKEIQGEAKYQVDAGKKVVLSVTIGNGQMGASAVTLGPRKWTPEVEVKDLELGTGAELAGKSVIIRSVVTDVNPNTNALVVTYVVRGGTSVLDHQLKAVVDADNEAARFQMTINFVGSAS